MYIHPTQDAGRALMERAKPGPIDMLNLLRFREVADYSASPELAPADAISGAQAYDRYISAVTPLIADAGAELIYQGQGGPVLIGPADERWDLVLIVRHASLAKFYEFATDKAYQAIAGHRTAALADSRLLPMQG